jgi:hypothetical protein
MTPYLKEITKMLDRITDGNLKTITIMKGASVGFTQIEYVFQRQKVCVNGSLININLGRVGCRFFNKHYRK